MRMPPLDTQYAVLPGIGQSSWTDVMLMIRPPLPWAIICLAAIWVPKKALFRLMSSTRSYCASVVSRIDVRVSMPALLTMMSRRPNALTAAATRRSRSSTLLTSASTPMALSPRATICCSRSSVACSLRDVVDDDVGAGRGQPQRHRLADAAVASGDDGHLACECHLERAPGRVGVVVDGSWSGSGAAARAAQHGDRLRADGEQPARSGRVAAGGGPVVGVELDGPVVGLADVGDGERQRLPPAVDRARGSRRRRASVPSSARSGASSPSR